MRAVPLEQARWLEAVLDTRIALPPGEIEATARAALEAEGLFEPAGRGAAEAAVREAARGRRIDWAARSVTQGDVLDAFHVHCRDALDDVEIDAYDGRVLVARWRAETSRVEARAGALGVERLAGGSPTLLLADLEGAGAGLVEAFLADGALRSSVLVVDLGRLEKVGAVRSSVFVHFEWFLREEYGVKVLPANRFTQGLLERGIISLGMG